MWLKQVFHLFCVFTFDSPSMTSSRDSIQMHQVPSWASLSSATSTTPCTSNRSSFIQHETDALRLNFTDLTPLAGFSSPSSYTQFDFSRELTVRPIGSPYASLEPKRQSFPSVHDHADNQSHNWFFDHTGMMIESWCNVIRSHTLWESVTKWINTQCHIGYQFASFLARSCLLRYIHYVARW